MGTCLIQQTDWPGLYTLGKNVDYLNHVRPFVTEAQLHDLRGILTKDFYNEVMEVAESGADAANGNLTKANYDTLLPLLKPIVVLYSAARYEVMSGAQSTRYGMVNKLNDYSEPVPMSEKKARAAQLRSNAATYISDLIEYLEENADLYPTWYKQNDNTAGRAPFGLWSV